MQAGVGYDVIGVRKETASGVRDDRTERKKVMTLAQARKIDAILVSELTRWGRSTMELVRTLQDLQAWKVSLFAQSGLQFDLSTAQSKLIASVTAALAEFERDLLRERIRSGVAAARARGVIFGRQPGQRLRQIARTKCLGARRHRAVLSADRATARYQQKYCT
jgi:putative DNA-invertase from lambdoid prophage Rac